jgi:nucleoside-triphosphatase THEP1
MPVVSRELIEYIEYYPSTAPSSAALTENGGVHPICGVCHRNIFSFVADATAYHRLTILDLPHEPGAPFIAATAALSFNRHVLLDKFNETLSVRSIAESPLLSFSLRQIAGASLMKSSAPLTTIWLKAALLGSLWASVEIVLGSFLHNIQFPITGTILAALGMCLSVAGAVMWDRPGLIWRAGAICAVMKSISPSAVILGPMIGIMLEALLLEATTRVFGRNAVGFLVGGALATSMPIVQRIVGIVFTYGTDAARLYVAIVDMATKSLGITSVRPADIILLLLAINVILGAIAVLVGMAAGKRARTLRANESPRPDHDAPSLFGSPDPSQKFSRTLLTVHTLLMPAGFLAINTLTPCASAPLIAVYFAACLFAYPGLRKRFRRPRLWIEFAGVSLLAGMVLGGFQHNNGATQAGGLMIGLQMALRATLVVVAFSAISVELRNPRVISWFMQRGLGQLSSALDVAFEALPIMTRAIGEEKRFLREPLASIARVLATAVRWMEFLETQTGAEPPSVFILTGEQGEGKTKMLLSLIDELRNRGIPVGGIVAPCVMTDGKRMGYDIEDIRTRQRQILCRIDAHDSGITAGPFRFRPEAIAFGRMALSPGHLKGCRVICVDEIGPLELSGKGWGPTMESLFQTRKCCVLLVVRRSLVDHVVERWHIAPLHVWNARDTGAGSVADEIRRNLA